MDNPHPLSPTHQRNLPLPRTHLRTVPHYTDSHYTDQHDQLAPITAPYSYPFPPGKWHLAVNVTISNFTPKPHTPFQWHTVSTAEFARKQAMLREALGRLPQVWPCVLAGVG